MREEDIRRLHVLTPMCGSEGIGAMNILLRFDTPTRNDEQIWKPVVVTKDDPRGPLAFYLEYQSQLDEVIKEMSGVNGTPIMAFSRYERSKDQQAD